MMVVWTDKEEIMPGRALRTIVLLTLWAFVFACCGIKEESVPSKLFPLRVDPSGRYLVDAEGAPFLLIGDAPQALIVNASSIDAESLLATRASHGFNAVWIMLLCNEYCGGRANASTIDGLKPFTRDGDLSTPNDVVFRPGRTDHPGRGRPWPRRSS